MSHVTHTIKRNETYHFNYRIGDNIYRKSLKTDSPSIARKAVSATIEHINRTKSVGGNVDNYKQAKVQSSLSSLDIDMLVVFTDNTKISTQSNNKMDKAGLEWCYECDMGD